MDDEHVKGGVRRGGGSYSTYGVFRFARSRQRGGSRVGGPGSRCWVAEMPPKRPATPRKTQEGEDEELSPFEHVDRPGFAGSDDDTGESSKQPGETVPTPNARKLRDQVLGTVDGSLGAVRRGLDIDGDGKVSAAEVMEATTKLVAPVVGRVDKHASRFVRSQRFKTLVHETFVDMDVDGTGTLDRLEIYCAVLKLYTKIIKFCSNAEPPRREEVDQLVQEFDSDNDLTISEAEFSALSAALCQHVAVRIVVQTSVSVFAAPIVARVVQFLLDRVTPGILTFWIPFKQTLRGPRNSLVLAMTCAFIMPKVLDWVWKQRSKISETHQAK